MKKTLTAFTLLMGMTAGAAHAQISSDQLIEGAKLCTRYLPRYEREYGVPTHLLSAIASTESGRYHEGLGLKLPWPWTINAEGKGYFYNTKQEAVLAANKMRMQGIKSMDIGCMQVNIMHHATAFSSLDEAFEPQKNIAYAASFLRNLYEEEHSWKQAAANYHSKTPALGRGYAGLVYNSWYNIIDKLRAAKLQVPDSSVAAMNDLKTLKTAALPAAPSPAAKTIKLASLDKTPSGYKSPRMNTIRMTSSQNSHENGVLIVRPDIKIIDSTPAVLTVSRAPETLTREPITLADMKPAAGQEARIIRVNGENTVRSTVTRSGPNFVFSD